MKVIAMDVMGGDHGVSPASQAAVEFCKENKDYKVILVGNEEKILKSISLSDNMEIIDSKKVATSGARSVRKEVNSMNQSINLIKEKKAGAVISAGPSGALVSSATLQLKRIPGISRPAFMLVLPCIIKDKKFLLLDAGANLTAKSEYLVQWAQLGRVFYKNVFSAKNPSTAIINIGTEESKGFEFHHEAYAELNSKKSNNFKGFIEPRNILNGEIDVVVTDGYAGNIFIKTIEGTGKTLLNMLKELLLSKFLWKIGAALSRGAYRNIKNKFDYRAIGSAWVIGVNGLVMKAHGESDKKAFLSSMYQTKKAIDNNTLEQFKKAAK